MEEITGVFIYSQETSLYKCVCVYVCVCVCVCMCVYISMLLK